MNLSQFVMNIKQNSLIMIKWKKNYKKNKQI